MVGWPCATANVADNAFQWLIQQVDGRMIVLSDTGFPAAEGDPRNLKLRQRGEWQDRVSGGTGLPRPALGCPLKKLRDRGSGDFQAPVALTLPGVRLLLPW